MHTSTLRLFNAIQVKEKSENEERVSEDQLRRCLQHGYILDPAIETNDAMLSCIEKVVGISGEKANAAFHKSWSIIQESSMESLVMQQLLHYFTTYGLEEMGLYEDHMIYIPQETLTLPELEDGLALTFIRALTAEEILQKIMGLASGIALAPQTLQDILAIVQANSYDSSFVRHIGNRELKSMLCDYYDIVPDEPQEYLRYVIGKLTNESLLIKNDMLIDKIKESNGKFLDFLLTHAPKDLATIFYRFKPLFLALKSISRNKTFFNRLRKDAVKQHKPLAQDYLNNITPQIKQGCLNLLTLQQRLEKASIFRKIRLAYALKHRLHAGNSIVYRVRNGRAWATEFHWSEELQQATEAAFDIVLDALTVDVQKNVQGKSIYIPKNIFYTLPATEKQFTGNFPSGSYVTVEKDLIVGVHWTDTDRRIDLDLSVMGPSGKIGWDAAYRSDECDVLFSGDVTAAPKPNGATELFYIKSGQKEPRIIMLNYYNFEKDDEVEAKLIAAQEKPKSFKKAYMVNPNNIIASANISISRKQNVLGLIVNIEGQNRVYFANMSMGSSISASGNEYTTHARNYLINSMTNSIALSDVLSRAGAKVVREKSDEEDIDLSPEKLDKTVIIKLLKPR